MFQVRLSSEAALKSPLSLTTLTSTVSSALPVSVAVPFTSLRYRQCVPLWLLMNSLSAVEPSVLVLLSS